MTVVDVGTATGEADQDQENGFRRLPAQLGVLPLRDSVTFPDLVIPLNIGQPRSLELVNEVLRGDRAIVLVAGRDPEVEAPGPDELYSVGALGTVARMVRLPDGTLRVLIPGGHRVRGKEGTQTEPDLGAGVGEGPDKVKQSQQLEPLARNVQRTCSSIVGQVPY